VPNVDVLLSGLSYDGGSTVRPGARFGPDAVRRASVLLGSYSEALGVDVYDELTVGDGGDVDASPFDSSAALASIATRAEAIARSGVLGGFVGGDQTVSLGVLRGIHRAKLRSPGLVHFDACTDTLGPSGGHDLHEHAAFRLALDEGLLSPDCVVHVGLRGPDASRAEVEYAVSRGAEIIKTDEVKWDLHAAVSQLRKLLRKGPVYVSVDVSVLDPAFAPASSCPRPGGLNTWELQQLLRGLTGAQIVGFDVVGVVPDHDAGSITAMAAASILHDLLAVIADTRRSAHPGSSRRSRRPGRLSP
jgi:agmatinase